MEDTLFSIEALNSSFRFCPRCGSDRFKPGSEKSFSCPACGHLYYINAGSAVAGLIFNENGDLLFTRRAHQPAKGMLDLPGGFVDLGEPAESALKREILEELNLTVTGLTYLGSFPNRYEFREVVYYTLDLAFRCEVESFETILPADDVAGFEFRPVQTVNPDEICFDSIRRMVFRK